MSLQMLGTPAPQHTDSLACVQIGHESIVDDELTNGDIRVDAGESLRHLVGHNGEWVTRMSPVAVFVVLTPGIQPSSATI